MPVVKGDKSGEEYDRYMNEAGTARVYTNRKTGKKMSDAEFKAAEGGFTESAGNTVGGGKDLSGFQRATSSSTSGMVHVKPADAPVIREEGSLGLAARMAKIKAEKGKAAPSPSPTPEPKKKKMDNKGQISALLGSGKRA